jgi:hypothetical protein
MVAKTDFGLLYISAFSQIIFYELGSYSMYGTSCVCLSLKSSARLLPFISFYFLLCTVVVKSAECLHMCVRNKI